MIFSYRFHPIAQEEYEDSVSWYLKRSLNAATNFVNVVDQALLDICKDPNRNKNEYKNYYEYNLQKYPFTIVYIIEESLIVIIAVYHQKREPNNKYR